MNAAAAIAIVIAIATAASRGKRFHCNLLLYQTSNQEFLLMVFWRHIHKIDH